MSDDHSEELSDLICNVLNHADQKEFKMHEKFGPKLDDCYNYYGSKIKVKHSDGSAYEITVNPINDIYDSNFGDYKECECGHTYDRHFDSYTIEMDPVGCKYCDCFTFKEK